MTSVLFLNKPTARGDVYDRGLKETRRNAAVANGSNNKILLCMRWNANICDWFCLQVLLVLVL